MLTIGEIVSLDEQAQFRNDVQLDSFDDPVKNLALLRSYLFTNTAPNKDVAGSRSISSIGLLDQIVQAFLSDRLENRLVAVANYGHGKSHLALALANYFSKPVTSAEVKTTLSKIESAVSDPAKASRYREFKQSRGEFLVIRLRGDQPRSLREQFMANLEQALAEHPKTAAIRPKFWFGVAEGFLRGLSATDRQKANDYLERRGTDLPQLLHQVEQRKDVYDECVALFVHLYNVPPNFGGEVSLKDVVRWATHNCCAEGGPLGGILILFDEFSLYIERYGQRNAAVELQDLLNGVDDQQGKVVFLAFAQHDPDTVAENIAMAGAVRESLHKALSRLPQKGRFALFSLMESVIDVYLQQDERAWQIFVQDPKVRGNVYQATDVTYDQFKKRYDRELGWPFEKFQETVTKGCFPLHPITTALLCTLKYASTGDLSVPRTVLGFVLQQLNQRKEIMAFENGQINWVTPIQLVDYFQPRLKGESYTAYQNAKRMLDPQAPSEQEAILKALLLYELAELNARGEDQIFFLAHCAGLDNDQTQKTLKSLAAAKCLRHDPSRKIYAFWAPSVNPAQSEEIIQRKLNDLTFDEAASDELVAVVKKLQGNFGQVAVAVDWGEQSDWAANEIILPAAHITTEKLSSLVQPFTTQIREVNGGERGCVAWLVAVSDLEIEWLRTCFVEELDKVFTTDAPIPIICVLPNEPLPELINTFQRLRALEAFNQTEREEVGLQMYEAELGQAKVALVREFTQLRGAEGNCLDVPRSLAAFRVPLAYRAHISGLPRPSVRSVISTCYKLAYRNAPPAFFTEFKLNSTNQKNATKSIANLLLRNSPELLRQSIQPDKVAVRLCTKFLQQEWQLLTSDYQIREPNSQSVHRAWQFLDAAFPPGVQETLVRETIVSLLNPPHGYDYNTVTLLFCAWLGFHSHDLQLSTWGQLKNRDSLAQMLNSGPKEFINEICIRQPLALARRDPGEVIKEVRTLLEKIQRETFTQEQARNAIAILQEFVENESNNPEVCQSASTGVATLTEALTLAQSYDQQAGELLHSLTTPELRALLTALNKVAKLPRSGLVQSTAQAPSEIRQKIITKLEQVVESDCQKYENLKQLTHLENNISQLRTRKEIVEKGGHTSLAQRIDKALQTLSVKAQELELQEREEAVRVEINSMDIKSGLSRLYNFKQRLDAIIGQSDHTMKLRNQRLQAVNEEIKRLEDRATSWQTCLDIIVEFAPLQQQYNELLRASDRYVDTPFEPMLVQAQERIQRLQEFMYVLDNVQNNINGGLKLPKDSENALTEIKALGEKYCGILSESQHQRLNRVVQSVQQHVTEKTNQALVWLKERQQDYHVKKQPVALWQSLQKAPSFLPAEVVSQLDELKMQVQEAIESDLISSIEQQFLRISTKQQRKACLQRLEKLLEA
jgi:hypothetical protein